MPFSYRRSTKIAPGVRLNVGKRGASVSLGSRAGGVNIGRRGASARVRTPIKGLSYRSRLSGCALPTTTLAALLLIALALLIS